MHEFRFMQEVMSELQAYSTYVIILIKILIIFHSNVLKTVILLAHF
jgi:hypothetical protein